MVANQKIVAAINEQMGNEFSAMLQYYAIAAHFGAEGLPELSAHFYKQAEQEEQVTTQINALLSMAKAGSDYTADNFLQWFIKEQLEEVASMGQLLRVVQRAGEGNLLRVEEYLAREKDSGVALGEEE